MKAVVFHSIGDIRLEDVAEPKIEAPTDAVIRITTSAICGTDLHMVRGTITGMKKGTILGHEAVGVVEEVGKGVRNLRAGDRVVVPSTIGCGWCSYCRAGYYSQCDTANPNGPRSGTAFFGGPEESGPFHGLQAELARIPFANVGLVKLPDSVTDDQAVLMSDIFPTGWFGADLAEIQPGDTVVVFGCGPVGQFAIAAARLMNAGRIFAVDRHESRLELARDQGAEVVNFEAEDPVEVLLEMTGGIGPDRAIDAVGVDAERPHKGPARKGSKDVDFDSEVEEAAPKSRPDGELWRPGDGPSQVLRWAVESLAKAGTLSIVGVYGNLERFPIGDAMEKNLTVQMGNCNHRKYIPELLELVESGVFDPSLVLSHHEPLTDAIAAFEAFDSREDGWLKVALTPGAKAERRRERAGHAARRSGRGQKTGVAK